MQTVLSADTVQHDAAMDRAAEKATASSKARQRAEKEAADATARAAKYATDVVEDAGRKMLAARKAESQAMRDLRALQRDEARGYIDAATAANAQAAALQRLTLIRKEMRGLRPEDPKQSIGGFVKERVSGALGSFDISEGMAASTAAVAALAAVVFELGNKMREAISSALEFGEAMQRASEKTGLSVQTLSLLHYASAITGGDFEGMSAAVAKMDKTIAAATEGDKKAQAFMKSLGLNARELADAPDGAERAFQRFAQVLASTENPIRRVELATGLLGRAGAEQIPTLIELGKNWDEFRQKASDAGVLMDGKMAQAFEATQQRIADLRQHMQGAGMALASGFVPAFSQILDVMSDGKGSFQAIADIGTAIARSMAFAASVVYGLGSGIEHLFQLIEGFNLTKIGRADGAAALRMDAESQRMMSIAIGRTPIAAPKPLVEGSGVHGGVEGFGGVGDLADTNEKNASELLKAMQVELDKQKIGHDMSLREEYTFWQRKQKVLEEQGLAYADAAKKVFTGAYKTIQDTEARLAIEGARKSHERIKNFLDQQKRNEREEPSEVAAVNRGLMAFQRDAYYAATERTDAGSRIAMTHAGEASRLAEFMQSSYGTSTGGAARAQAQLASAQYQAQQSELQRHMAEVGSNPWLTGAEREKQIAALQEQSAALEASYRLQDAENQKRIESTTLLGGASDTLREFIRDSTNAGAAMRQWFGGAINTTNQAIVRAMTGDRPNWGQAGHEIFASASSSLLKGAEGSLLGAFGIGKKRDGTSEATALWVQIAQGNKAAMAGMGSALPGWLGKIPGMPSVNAAPGAGSGFLSGIGGFLMKMIPGFANGVDNFSGGYAWVGERGPELLNLPHGSSVIPNHRLPSMGGHTVNVDARGATDPAQVQAAVNRALVPLLPSLASGIDTAQREMRLRGPSMRRS